MENSFAFQWIAAILAMRETLSAGTRRLRIIAKSGTIMTLFCTLTAIPAQAATPANCAQMLLGHIQAQAPETFQPSARLDAELEASRDALVLFRLPLAGVSLSLASLMDFSYAPPGLAIPSEFLNISNGSLFLVARGSSRDLEQFGRDLGQRHKSLSFQILDAQVEKRVFRWAVSQQLFQVNRDGNLDRLRETNQQFEELLEKGEAFTVFDVQLGQMVFIYPAADVAPVMESATLREMLNVTLIQGEKRGNLIDWLKINREALSKGAIMVPRRGHVILNQNAFNKIRTLEGKSLNSPGPKIASADRNLLNVLRNCSDQSCVPVAQAALKSAQPEIAQAAAETSRALQTDAPAIVAEPTVSPAVRAIVRVAAERLDVHNILAFLGRHMRTQRIDEDSMMQQIWLSLLSKVWTAENREQVKMDILKIDFQKTEYGLITGRVRSRLALERMKAAWEIFLVANAKAPQGLRLEVPRYELEADVVTEAVEEEAAPELRIDPKVESFLLRQKMTKQSIDYEAKHWMGVIVENSWTMLFHDLIERQDRAFQVLIKQDADTPNVWIAYEVHVADQDMERKFYNAASHEMGIGSFSFPIELRYFAGAPKSLSLNISGSIASKLLLKHRIDLDEVESLLAKYIIVEWKPREGGGYNVILQSSQEGLPKKLVMGLGNRGASTTDFQILTIFPARY